MFGFLKKAYKDMNKQAEEIVEKSSLGLNDDVTFTVKYEYGNWNKVENIVVCGSNNPLESLKNLADEHMAVMTKKAEGGYVEYSSRCGKYTGAWVR